MKRSIKKIISIAAAAALLVVIIGNYTESYATGAYGVDLSSVGYNTLNPYGSPQCTWYCWGRAYEKLGISMPKWEHAKTWDEYADADPNYRVGTEARENSIMVESYDDGDGFGHVMFVEKVENGYAYITEGNWLGAQYHEDRINLSTRVRDSWQSHVMHEDIKYIYLGCTEHKWDKGKVTKKAKHTKTELVNGEKTYTCTVCGETKTEVIKVSHDFKTTKTTVATPDKNGSVKKKCDVCGKTKTVTIYRPKPIEVKKSPVVYTGKSLKPEVVVKDVKGKKILKQYYTVSYKNNRKLGIATAIVKFRGKYSGSKSVSFKIVPKAAKLIDCTGGSKRIKVTWKRVKGIDGYQIQYSKKKSFSNSKTVTVNKSKSLSRTIKKLSAGTTYYVRVRTYKTEKNKKYYSSWSNVMSAKTKAAASSGYVEITTSPVKAGSYYYKQNGWNILRSKKKTSGYTTILEPDTYFYQYVYTNGTYLYTVEETNTSADDEVYYLVRYSASGKNRKVIKKLPHDPDDSLGFWWIAASRGQKLILTHGEDFRLFTYVYDVKAGKLTKVLNDRAIMNTVSGKNKSSSYVICEHYMDTAGIVASAKSLYRINSDGKMTLIMNLGDNVDAAFIGDKLYYVKFDYDFNEFEGYVDVYIYSCKADGTGKTLIHSYTDYYENGCVLGAGNFTSNTCDIYIDNSVAHVNYSDGTIEWEYPDYY